MPAAVPIRGILACLPLAIGLTAEGASLTVDRVTATPGSTATVAVRFSPQGSSVACMQFDLEYGAELRVAGSAGEAATAANKGFHGAEMAPGRTRFVLAGLNRNPLGDGVLVSLAVTVNAGATAGAYPLRILNSLASEPDGYQTGISGTDGSVTVGGGVSAPVSGILAQVAAGGGWKTSISLMNLSAAAAPARVQFWDDSGAPLVLPLVFPGQTRPPTSGSFFEVVIPPGGLVDVEAGDPAHSAVQAGWAQLLAPAGVSAWATFGMQLPSGQRAEAVVQMETRAPAAFVLPYDNSNGFVTGVAVASGSETAPARIMLVARDSEGRHVLTDVLNLPVRGHTSFAVPDKYPLLSGGKGSLEFQNLQSGSLSVLGLRFSPAGSVTSIPAAERN